LVFWRAGYGKKYYKMLKYSCMVNTTDLKNNLQMNLSELRMKRKDVIVNFRKKVEEAKIEQIRKSITDK